jgi:hypothetical protein
LRSTSTAGLHVLLLAAVGWFYFWTAVPEANWSLLSPEASGYYSLLTRGMAKGHLYLDRAADPFLATLKNPADPIARAGHGMHDASYYRGHYYLYFGVTPVVVLLLPFRLLTGHLLDESLASPLFCFVGFLISVRLLRQVRRRYFPRLAEPALFACDLALGLANFVPIMLRRVSVWEVPISCGYACCMLALYALFESGHRPRRTLWLAVASASLGLAVGSRPTYLFGCVALLVPLVREARSNQLGLGAWRDRAWRRLAWAAIAPVAAIGVGLALYNVLRFGDPLDFGFRHLMNSDRMDTERLFSWSFAWYNLRVYLLAPGGWTAFYPFVSTASVPVPPAGHLGVEDPYGVLPNLPFALLALVPVGWTLRLRSVDSAGLRAFRLAAWLLVLGTGAAVSAFGGAINRYMVDFVPTLIVLACIGLLSCAEPADVRGGLRRALRRPILAAAGLALLYSALFDILASARHNELFRADHPALYRRVAHRWNRLSDLWDRWRGTVYGPVEMTVVFPTDRVGQVEPLLATGRSFLADYLFVHYASATTVQFGLSHTSRDGVLSEPIAIAPGQPHTLRIDLGSLYPPSAHPYFDRLSPGEARLRATTVRVTCDGQVVLDRRMDLYDAVSAQPDIGHVADRPAFRHPFSGRILGWRRVANAPLSPAGPAYGPFLLRAVLPPFTAPRNEPLLSLGETGAGDLVYVRYQSPTAVSFGYDHWSLGGPVTPPIPIDPSATQLIEIDSAALDPAADDARGSGATGRGRLRISLNGAVVFSADAPYYRFAPGTVAVGVNAIQSSTAQPLFTGRLIEVERLPVRGQAAPR